MPHTIPPVHHADPGTRRQAMIWVAVGLIAGGVLVLGLQHYQHDWLAWLDHHLTWLPAMSLLLLSPLFVAAAYCYALGGRIVRHERWPPPGYRVMRDTRVQEGKAAVFRGRTIQLLSVALLLSLAAIPLFFWRALLTMGPI